MKKYFFYILLCLSSLACTEKIDLELASLDERILIVDAAITNLARPDSIILSYTSNYYQGGDPPFESNARVSISVNDSEYVFTPSVEKPGYYIRPSNFTPQINNLYTLNIEVDGKNYTATSFMHEVPAIDSIGQRRLDEDRTIGGGEIELTISFQDPPGMRNYYLYRQSVNDTFYFENLLDYAVLFDDFILQGQYAELIPFGLFEFNKGDTVELFAHSMDKQSYEIYNALLAESEFKGGFFDAPSSNVPSNLNNGAKGLFVVHDVKSRKIIINE